MRHEEDSLGGKRREKVRLKDVAVGKIGEDRLKTSERRRERRDKEGGGER